MDVLTISSLVNFAVLVAVLYHFTKKPVALAFEGRHAELQKYMADAQGRFSAVESRFGQIQRKWKSVEDERRKLEDDAKSSFQAFRNQRLVQVKAEAERVVRDARVLAENERLSSRTELEREVAHQSVQLARHYLSSHLDDKENHRLVSDYLEIIRNGKA